MLFKEGQQWHFKKYEINLSADIKQLEKQCKLYMHVCAMMGTSHGWTAEFVGSMHKLCIMVWFAGEAVHEET